MDRIAKYLTYIFGNKKMNFEILLDFELDFSLE